MHIRGDDWNPVNLRSGMDASWARQVRWFEPPQSDPSYLHASVAQATDLSGDKAVARMDEAGVDASVMMPMDHGVGLGDEGVIPIEEKNRLCAEATKRHPGRLYTFCGVDPRRPNALEILRTAVEEWGAIGLKLYPTNGFYPDDENLVYPLYRFLTERDLPVLLHQGHSAGRHKSKYGHPIYVDSAAADFPEPPLHPRPLRPLRNLGTRSHLRCHLQNQHPPRHEPAATLDLPRRTSGLPAKQLGYRIPQHQIDQILGENTRSIYRLDDHNPHRVE